MTKLPDAVIFDVDGTLCDVRPIRHYVEGDAKNFDAFHTASAFCHPNADVADAAVDAKEAGLFVIVVTGRSRKFKLLTAKWLRAWGIPFDELHTRADGDYRKDFVIKREILTDIRTRYNPVHSWDDNPEVINGLWVPEGIPVTVVPGWGT